MAPAVLANAIVCAFFILLPKHQASQATHASHLSVLLLAAKSPAASATKPIQS
jgi:hypothetical protein